MPERGNAVHEAEWRVYRYEHPDGRYVELATNQFSPEEIQLPPSARGYQFVRSTPMSPKADCDRYREALKEIAGDYGCGLLEPGDVSEPARDGDPCRERWPDEPSQWCVLCIASAALYPDPEAAGDA